MVTIANVVDIVRDYRDAAVENDELYVQFVNEALLTTTAETAAGDKAAADRSVNAGIRVANEYITDGKAIGEYAYQELVWGLATLEGIESAGF